MQPLVTPSYKSSVDHSTPAWAWLIVIGLMLTSGYLGALGSPYLDPVRDIYWAHQIASFSEWPLVGPEIGFFTHLGPIWYYLLAPALWIDTSFTAVAVWAGLLQGSQFLVALFLGRALGNWRFGLLLALLLALPGLHSFAYQSFNHFNLVPAAVLALLLMAWRDWQRPNFGRALILGLVFALMLHAHPATVALGWIPLVSWLRASNRARRLIAFSLGTITPFVPLLIAVATDQLPETPTGGALAHLGTHFDINALAAAPALLWHTLVGGAHHGLILVSQDVPVMQLMLTVGLLLLVALALAGVLPLIRQTDWRSSVVVIVLAIGAQITAALLMRAETLWYMMLAVPTLVFVLMALLLAAIDWPPLRRLVLPLMLTLGLGSMVTLLLSFEITSDDNGRRHFPAAFMMNLQVGAAAGVSYPGPQLSFIGGDRLARRLCSVSGPLILHGAAAQQADILTDLASTLHCPNQIDSPQIAGQPAELNETDRQHWLAVGPRIAEQLERPAMENPTLEQPALKQLESLHFYSIGKVVHPEQTVSLASARDYPPRPRLAPAKATQNLRFEVPCGQPLVVSNPYPWWAPMSVESVSANGQLLAELAFDSVSRLYQFDDCRSQTTIVWEVEFRAPASMPPDIVTIATSSRLLAN